MQLVYPHKDCKLLVRVCEKVEAGRSQPLATSELLLDTYQAEHLPDVAFDAENMDVCVYGKMNLMKKALKEFAYLPASETLTLAFQEDYPKLALSALRPDQDLFHLAKFNSDVPDLHFKRVTAREVRFNVDALRLAFTRFSQDSLIFILTLNTDSLLSVKIVPEDKKMMIESIVLPKDADEDE